MTPIPLSAWELQGHGHTHSLGLQHQAGHSGSRRETVAIPGKGYGRPPVRYSDSRQGPRDRLELPNISRELTPEA